MLTIITPLYKEALETPLEFDRVPYSSFKEFTFVNKLNEFDSLTILLVEFKDERLFNSWKRIIDDQVNFIIEKQNDKAIDDGSFQNLIEIASVLKENNNKINNDYGLIQVPPNKSECITYLKSLSSTANNSDYFLSLFNVSEIDQLLPNFQFNTDQHIENQYNTQISTPAPQVYDKILSSKEFELDKDGKIISNKRLDSYSKNNVIQNSTNIIAPKRNKIKFIQYTGYFIIGLGWIIFLREFFFKYLSPVESTIAIILMAIGFFSLMSNRK